MEAVLSDLAIAGYEPMASDTMTERLAPKIVALAKLLLKAKEERRFVLLRFHHDADGICAAFAISGILRFQPYQQNGAAYSVKDAIRDLGNISHEQKPLVMLLDFGLNRESEEGLALLKAGGAEVVAIDHHPPTDKAMMLVDFALTPWEFSKDGSASRYVAGYLASEVARAAGATGMEQYARIACAGDKSALLGEAGGKERDAALVLDYMAAHSGYGNNLRFYKNTLDNRELFSSMLEQADEKINEAADKAMRGMKERKAGKETGGGKDGVAVFLIDLEKVVRTGEFPNRSKVTTRVFERLNARGRGAFVVLGIGERTVIMRISQEAADRGLSADSIAKQMQESMRDFVESGGGHAKAGAIRVKPGFASAVAEEILKLII